MAKIRFRDRLDAGKQLAQRLKKYGNEKVVVYALPRGGVILGVEVAKTLQAPLDLLIPRKIGHPLNPEYAICAVTEDGTLICSDEQYLKEPWFKESVRKEVNEARRRRETYMSGRQPLSAKGKLAIIVDDGIATGLTMLAAIKEVKKQNPKKIVVAVPVAPVDIAEKLQKEVNEFVAVAIPDQYLGAVGAYYDSFDSVSDEEVIDLLNSTNS